ncbi:YpfB family protein [Microbacteriaceae bacterium 4G12]
MEIEMKRIEGILLRIVILHFIFLFIAQALLTYEPVARYLTKVVYYEGVTKGTVTNILETGK